MNLKKILIAEDDTTWKELYKDVCKDKCILFEASTLKQAEELFLENKNNLDLIIMDGSLENGSRVDTLELIGKIVRESEKSRIVIAASGSSNSVIQMMNAGCYLGFDKGVARDFLRNFLK